MLSGNECDITAMKPVKHSKPTLRRKTDNPKDAAIYQLAGDWVSEQADSCVTLLDHFAPHNDSVGLEGAAVTHMDITGAWLLVNRVLEMQRDGQTVTLSGFDERAAHFLQQADDLRRQPVQPPPPCPTLRQVILTKADSISRSLLTSLSFLGEFWLLVGATLRHPGTFRLRAFVKQCDVAAVRAAPIVAFTSFLIAIVLAYQGSAQLQRFGAQIFSIDLVTISVLREMGVLLTAIMVAGRSGSAFAAEIGTMKLNEELDALKTTGMEPMEVLVLPRVLALTVMMPLLTFLGDMTSFVGCGLLTVSTTSTSWQLFYARLTGAVHMKDFWIGVGKAPVFGLMIALVGCYHGLSVANSAESVGRETTNAVVNAIFAVMLADALFSIVFTMIGI